MHSATELVDRIETMVVDGQLQPGDRLPTIRDLADTVAISVNTVAAAYRRLARRGVVSTQGRRGTFVADLSVAPVADPPVAPGLLDLASGNPDPDLLPDLDRYLPGVCTRKVLYGEPSVEQALDPIARAQLETAGVPVGALAVVGGALDGVERALQAHLRIGDAVAVEAPGWPAFGDLVRAMGLRPVPVAIDDRGMIPHRLAAAAGSLAAVVMAPRAQNPTGAAVDAERAGQLRSVLADHPETLVIEDDHGGLISGVELSSVGAGRKRWCFVQSVSKSLGPDLRLAYLTGDDLTVSRIRARQCAGAGWVSHVLQRLVAEILADPGTPALLETATRRYGERRHALLDALTSQGVHAQGWTGLNVWAHVVDWERAVGALADAGFAVRSGERWHMGGPAGIRISIGQMPPERAEEIAAVVAHVAVPSRRTAPLAPAMPGGRLA